MPLAQGKFESHLISQQQIASLISFNFLLRLFVFAETSRGAFAKLASPERDRGHHVRDFRAEENGGGARGRDRRIKTGSREHDEAGRRGARARAKRPGGDRKLAAQHRETGPGDRAEKQATGSREGVSESTRTGGRRNSLASYSLRWKTAM